MVTIILPSLRLEPVKAHLFELAVDPWYGAGRVALDRELSTDRTSMPAISCVCQRPRFRSLEDGHTQTG
jgi:hypothetical protein